VVISKAGRTALMYAAIKGDFNIVQYLQSCGAAIDTVDVVSGLAICICYMYYDLMNSVYWSLFVFFLYISVL
jgi:hypothetical protein